MSKRKVLGLYSEKTVGMTIRVPESKKQEIRIRIYDLLKEYQNVGEYEIEAGSQKATKDTVMKDIAKGITLESMDSAIGKIEKKSTASGEGNVVSAGGAESGKIKDYLGGSVVRKSLSECFLIDKYKNFYRDVDFPDDFYVRDGGRVIHFTNPNMALEYMRKNEIR